MDILQAIHGRRSVGKVRPDPVPRALVEELLEAARWAPTHHRTEPWRFWVFTGQGRDRLAEAFAAAGGDKERNKPYRAPVVVAVGCVPQPAADSPQEELLAVGAAVQNLLLAAQAKGLAAIWRSGTMVYDPVVRELLGLAEKDVLVGFVYLGFPDPDVTVLTGRRSSVEERTVWYE